MIIALGLSTASAQTVLTTTSTPDTLSPKNAAQGRLVSKRDVIVLAGATVTTAAVAPFDRDIQRTTQAEDLQESRGLHRAAKALAFTGGPGPFVAGGALYVAGRATSSPRVATLGVTLTEAVVVAAALNGVVKGLAGRQMPNVESGKRGHFSFGRGFHEGNGPFVSFPSGHTAASFAVAAVLSDAASNWGPVASRLVPAAAYTGATLVAVSRVYQNLHWASDLPLGAAIGIWSGKTVAAWKRRHPDNWLTRRDVGLGVVPDKHRLTITAALPLESR